GRPRPGGRRADEERGCAAGGRRSGHRGGVTVSAESRVETLGGVATGVLDIGSPEAPAVVVAHSAGLDSGSVLPFARLAAAAGWRVVAVDLRGHGRSQATPAQVHRDGMAADLVEVVERLGL